MKRLSEVKKNWRNNHVNFIHENNQLLDKMHSKQRKSTKDMLSKLGVKS
jgi:NADH dehydrogenase FAD-containing subunit